MHVHGLSSHHAKSPLEEHSSSRKKKSKDVVRLTFGHVAHVLWESKHVKTLVFFGPLHVCGCSAPGPVRKMPKKRDKLKELRRDPESTKRRQVLKGPQKAGAGERG